MSAPTVEEKEFEEKMTPNASEEMNTEENDVLKNCAVYFDGCNNCQVGEDGGLACTRKFCETPETPKCLKTKKGKTTPTTAIPEKAVSYQCDENNSFTVEFFGNDAGAATFSDAQTGTTLELAHVASASDAKYENQENQFVFWSKGNDAFVTQGEKELYTNCKTQ